MIPKIDLEAHFYDEPSFAAMAKNKGKGWPYYTPENKNLNWAPEVSLDMNKLMPKFLDFMEMRLPDMDKNGIVKQVLSLGPGPDALGPDLAVEACRKSNDALAKAIEEAPDRFLGAASLPMNDPEAAIEELDHCVNDLGFVMVQGHSNYGDDTYPDQKRFWPVWEEVARLGTFVYLHPTVTRQPMFLDYGYPFANSALGFTIDALGAAVRMILSGIFDEIPDLKIVLGHFGEALPFLMVRLDSRLKTLPKQSKIKCQKAASEYFGPNIQVTTSGNPSKDAFVCTKSAIGIENIMFGSDYPYEDITRFVKFIDELPMTQDELEMLYYKNAEKLLGIKL